MRPAIRWIAGLLAVLAISAAYYRQDDEKDKAPLTTQTLDKAIFESLRDVINRGAEVYNDGDHAGCYRIFEGALRSVKPLLAHYPDLQKLIAEKLTSAEGDPVVWRRAFTLRSALDKVREKLNPNPKKPADKDKELKGKPKEQPDKDKKDDQDKKDAEEAKKKKDDEDKKKKDDEDKKNKEDENKKKKDDQDKQNTERLPLPDVEKIG
jgi:hypothetical protein